MQQARCQCLFSKVHAIHSGLNTTLYYICGRVAENSVKLRYTGHHHPLHLIFSRQQSKFQPMPVLVISQKTANFCSRVFRIIKVQTGRDFLVLHLTRPPSCYMVRWCKERLIVTFFSLELKLFPACVKT